MAGIKDPPGLLMDPWSGPPTNSACRGWLPDSGLVESGGLITEGELITDRITRVPLLVIEGRGVETDAGGTWLVF